MTQREKILAGAAVGLIVVVGGGLLAQIFVFDPLSTLGGRIVSTRERLAQKQAELTNERAQIDAILAVNKRLLQWNKISLPPRDPKAKEKYGTNQDAQKTKHVSAMQVDYEKLLSDMMRSAGIRPDTIGVQAKAPDRRMNTTPQVKGKEPPFERLAFVVTGKGSMDAMTRVLRQFHQTPLLHQIRTIRLDLANRETRTTLPEGTLDLTMTIESLIVAGAEERSTLLPALKYQPAVMADPPRDYGRMVWWNMYSGYKPYVSPPATVVVKKDDKPKEEKKQTGEKPELVLKYVKLTTIWYNFDRNRWEASLYDQAKGGAEVYINTGVRNELTIEDKDRFPVFEAKVVRIDEDQVILKSANKFFRVRCGDFLHPAATTTALTKSEMDALGLKPDPEPAKKEKEKNKETKEKEKTQDPDEDP